MSGPRAQPSHPKPHRSQRTSEPKAPKVIPSETVREYVDRMEALVGHVHSATGKSPAECGKDGNELKQEEDDTYLDPCLLSYIDELRSREDSVTKVGWAWSLGSTRCQGMELSAPKIWVLLRPMGLKLSFLFLSLVLGEVYAGVCVYMFVSVCMPLCVCVCASVYVLFCV